MQIQALLLIVCIASSQALPFIGKFNGSEKYKKFLDGFRDVMRKGNDSLGIPVLDPYENEEIKLNLNQGTVEATLQNVKVIGLSEYVVNSASFRFIGLRFTTDLTWNEIKSTIGKYTLNATVSDIPVYGQGDIEATCKNLHCTVNFNLSVRESRLYIRKISSTISLGSLDFKVTGLYNDEEMSKMVSVLVSDMVPQLLEDYQKEVTSVLNNIIRNKLDSILSKLSMTDLLKILK